MIPFTSFILIPFLATPTFSAVDVSVPLCFQSGVQWVVTEGTVGGVTYVETTTNENCVFNISNSVSQTFITNYTNCGTSTAISLGGAIHEFIIVVQDVSIFNAATDSRWKIRCEFNTGTSSVESIFVAQSNNPSGNPNNNITRTINPRPVLNLYTTTSQGDEIKINSSSVLVLGTNITARITLDQNTTDYSLQVISGEMSSQIIGQISILSTVALLNSTTYCGLYSVFKSFNYKKDVDKVNYAEAEFEAFIPTVTSINLQTTNVQLRLSFRVTLCLVGSGCVQTLCPDHTARRRRQINDDATSPAEDQDTESATYDLTEGFTVQMNESPDENWDITDGVVEIGTNPDVMVCLEKTKFWGLIIGLIVAMILACIASCGLCFFISKRRRQKSVKRTMSGTSNVTTVTTISSNRKLTGEPVNNQAFLLPRFVPVSSSGSSR